MHLEERIKHLLEQIERQEHRWDKVAAHPSYKKFAGQQPALRRSITRMRTICDRFKTAVVQNDPQVPQYLDQLEESMFYLARDMDRLCDALGFATPPARTLN